MIFEDFVHTGLGALLIKLSPFRIAPQQNRCHIQVNHRNAEGPALPGFGNGFGAKTGGVGHAAAQIPVHIVGAAGALQAGFLAGDAVILGVSHGIKSLGKVIPALAQRLAVSGDGEIHPVVGLPVQAVGLHKVQAAFGRSQPFFADTVGVAQKSVNPSAAALHPHAFVGGINLALAVQTGVHAAMLAIHSVVQPEPGATLQL